MRSRRIIKAAGQAIEEACFAVFDITVAIWNFAAWMKQDSTLSGWLGLSMAVLGVFEICIFKKSWTEFRALCAEIKD